MAEFIDVQTDFEEVYKMFEKLEKEKVKVVRAILSGTGSTAKNRAKKKYKQKLGMGTGKLYNSITRKVIKSGKAVIIEAKARKNEKVFYGYALAKGSKITAKNAKTLTFKIDDKWVRKHEVKLPQFDFIEEPVNAYLNSPEFPKRIDKILQKQLDKLESKGYTITR